MKLSFPTPIEYRPFINHPWVLTIASEIVSGANDGRPLAAKLEDAQNGLALQLAVATELLTQGRALYLSDLKEIDLVVLASVEVPIDVKGMFKPEATTFHQSSWEGQRATGRLGAPIVYTCFDCRSGVGVFRGFAVSSMFSSSKFTPGRYIYPNRLVASLSDLPAYKDLA